MHLSLSVQRRKYPVAHQRRSINIKLHVVHNVEYLPSGAGEGRRYCPDLPVINGRSRILQLTDRLMKIIIYTLLQTKHGRHIFDNPVLLVYFQMTFQIQIALVPFHLTRINGRRMKHVIQNRIGHDRLFRKVRSIVARHPSQWETAQQTQCQHSPQSLI